MSLHRLSAGTGFRYLLRHTASGDAARPGQGLSEYYQATGNPPGRWLGSGLAGLGDGTGLATGSVVTEAAMTAVFGAAVDPVNGRLLGRAVPRNGVAGFDLTFTAPKSVSVLWALGDSATRRAIEAAHHDAIADLLAHIESRALTTRTGHAGAVPMATRGAVAAAFDHYDSRAHDPHLHTHLVIANRVQGLDGVWRAIDARDLHAGAVAFSELYDGMLADHLARTLPVRFSWRERGPRRAPVFELDGVDDALLAVYSSRAHRIDAAMVGLLTDFEARHGRRPDRVETLRLRQQATLATRPTKTVEPLAALRLRWAEQAAAAGHPPGQVLDNTLTTPPPTNAPPLTDLAAAVVTGTAQRRSTWTRWNLAAEAARALKTVRYPTVEQRLAAVDDLTDAATRLCIPLHDPATVASRARWTSRAVLDAEQRLLDAAADVSAPTAYVAPADTETLAPDQATALSAVSGSGRRVEVIVGPAGAGKTTLLRAVATAWQRTHGHGTVIGLAPSASAADTLATALSIRCENTAKWLHDTALRPAPNPGQLIVVDEASLASTATLDAVTAHAVTADAKVLLVGDHHQLAAVEAGGGFGLLARRTPASELTALWRFRNRWEADATRRLRRGDTDALDAYAAHGRLHDGSREDMTDAAYTAWATDRARGLESLLLAPDGETVAALNAQARADRILAGTSTPEGTSLRDGTTAGVGDTVMTRLNARNLTDHTGRYVRNGDRWTVVRVTPWGDLDVLPADRPLRGDPDTPWHQRWEHLTLPREYVAEHVQLGYAATIHAAQGRTVDTCHVVTSAAMAREHLYVALTRGRHANHAYTPTDGARPDAEPHQHAAPSPADARQILTQILATSHAELSATEQLAALGGEPASTRWQTPDGAHTTASNPSPRQEAGVDLGL